MVHLQTKLEAETILGSTRKACLYVSISSTRIFANVKFLGRKTLHERVSGYTDLYWAISTNHA
ncbi:uncharacterized protein PHALS_05342 [Plasmopara halstedii]|uniref:Uncharacterized protein n=1 Tax=Plasmopara halstedii TaxID=4781 RepID=A0A0P1AAY6_PLAHL|nr:uncharacterized protein PHALS_05342 [Plasmopara halstedii]CEG37562.1 hypothetical protein PHALS_05342 [Plasmopara halstedii]|eukprot:XP_024573931.1 hypothetical protein PHALS_05342 [Plasmopara halstedii]